MIRNLFSVMKIAVVVMMLVWVVKQARAQGYPTCSDPIDPSDYSACMSQCATAAEACDECCDTHCSGDPNCPCLSTCETEFDACATACYNNYCI